MEGSLTFSLPMPPGVNNLFASIIIKGKQRRIITHDYRIWRDQAEAILARYNATLLPKPYGVHIRVNTNYRSDVDGRAKAPLDALVRAGIIKDDCWIDKLTIERDRTVKEMTVEVWSLAEE